MWRDLPGGPGSPLAPVCPWGPTGPIDPTPAADTQRYLSHLCSVRQQKSQPGAVIAPQNPEKFYRSCIQVDRF